MLRLPRRRAVIAKGIAAMELHGLDHGGDPQGGAVREWYPLWGRHRVETVNSQVRALPVHPTTSLGSTLFVAPMPQFASEAPKRTIQVTVEHGGSPTWPTSGQGGGASTLKLETLAGSGDRAAPGEAGTGEAGGGDAPGEGPHGWGAARRCEHARATGCRRS